MNKTLLLIICDFLLISILALAEFRPAEMPDAVNEQAVVENSADDMLELLKLSLENEQQQRASLSADLQERESALEETSTQLEQVSSTLEQTAAAKADLESTAAQLNESLQTTRSSLAMTEEEKAALARSLEDTRQRTERLQSELQSEQERASSNAAALAEARRNLQSLESQQATLQTELRVRDTERDMLQQNLIAARAEVDRARIEAESAERRVENLSRGVTELAQSSTAMKEEIRQAQPLSMNVIFQRFESTRLPLRFSWRESRLFGDAPRESTIQAVLVRGPDQRTVALFSTENTPLDTVEGVAGELRFGDRVFQVAEVGRLAQNIRIATIEIPSGMVEESGLEPFELSADPLRFPEAVLISDRDAVYGEIPLRIPSGETGRLQIESRLFSRLFGEYTPRTGDYVFSKSGHLIGVMASPDRAEVLDTLRRSHVQRLAVPN